MMQVENKKIIEGLHHDSKDCFKKLRSTNNSTVLREQNNRIIKLIRQKKYPLHASNKSALIFPKLKENYPTRKQQPSPHFKKYIEVNLEDQRTNPHARVRTDIEEELIHKYQLNIIKKNSDYEASQFNYYTKLLTNKKHRHSQKRKTLQDQCEETSALHRHSSHLQNSAKYLLNLNSDSLQDRVIIEQGRLHSEFLKSIKNRLERGKEDFFRKLNLTEMIPCSNQKECCNIEYIVSLLQARDEKEQLKGSNCAYQKMYPNKLGNYLSILNKKEKKVNIWEQFEKAELMKEKINQEGLKSMHLMENADHRNIAVVEDESEFQQEHLLSAKYRMKANHRKLIEISKSKSKN